VAARAILQTSPATLQVKSTSAGATPPGLHWILPTFSSLRTTAGFTTLQLAAHGGPATPLRRQMLAGELYPIPFLLSAVGELPQTLLAAELPQTSLTAELPQTSLAAVGELPRTSLAVAVGELPSPRRRQLSLRLTSCLRLHLRRPLRRRNPGPHRKWSPTPLVLRYLPPRYLPLLRHQLSLRLGSSGVAPGVAITLVPLNFNPSRRYACSGLAVAEAWHSDLAIAEAER